jgi:hypothetical protein
MTPSITSPNGRNASRNVNAANFDLSRLPNDAKKIAAVKANSNGLTSVTKTDTNTATATAMGPTTVGLTSDQVKALTTAYMPVAQNIVDTTYGKYIKSAPKLQLKFATQEELKAAGKKNADSLFAFVDNKVPNTINVAY